MKDFQRLFQYLFVIFLALIPLIVIKIIREGIIWNDLFRFPYISISVLLFFFISIPHIFSFINFYFQKFRIRKKTFFTKAISFEQWKEGRRIFSIQNQELFIDYYKELREIIGDEKIIDRILSFEFQKGDKIEYIFLTLGFPDFIIHQHIWLFYDRISLYYFPYYKNKSIFSFFKLNFKFKFIFNHGQLIEYYIDIAENDG